MNINKQTTSNKDHAALKDLSSVFDKLINRKENRKGQDALKVENLSFSIKKRLLLNKVSFEVKGGSFHGLLGPNGAGKTTTIKNLIDAYKTRSDESSIKIFGEEASSLEAKKQMAYIPEYASFPEHLSALEYLTTMARFSGINKEDALPKAKELLKTLNLEAHSGINPNKFSSGMKKKILLGQSLMTNPSLLILDEPAANLDPLARDSMFKSLKSLCKHGIAILISSHILAELEGLIDSITLINHGNVVYSGPIEEFSTTKDKTHSIKLFSPEDEKAINAIIKKHGAIKREEAGHVSVEFETKKQMFMFLQDIAKDEIEVSKIEFNKVSLQDIYNSKFGGNS